MAESRRNQSHLGIDSNILVAYLVPDHLDRELMRPLAKKMHAVNPTVIHETYHTCVFKLRRNPEVTARSLLEYMKQSLCLPINSDTVDLGLKFALEYRIGGRDALILASYASSDHLRRFVTLDQSLLAIKEVTVGKRSLRIVKPNP